MEAGCFLFGGERIVVGACFHTSAAVRELRKFKKLLSTAGVGI
jgi:hypothetical protein